MTGFTAPVFYRHTLTKSVRNFVMRGVVPFLGGLILLAAFLQAAHDYWLVGPDADSTTSWRMPFPPHWAIGGIFLTGIGALVLGVVLMLVTWVFMPPFFRGETLPEAHRGADGGATSCPRSSATERSPTAPGQPDRRVVRRD